MNFLRVTCVEVVLGDALVLCARTPPASEARGSQSIHLHLQKKGSVVCVGVTTQTWQLSAVGEVCLGLTLLFFQLPRTITYVSSKSELRANISKEENKDTKLATGVFSGIGAALKAWTSLAVCCGQEDVSILACALPFPSPGLTSNLNSY